MDLLWLNHKKWKSTEKGGRKKNIKDPLKAYSKDPHPQHGAYKHLMNKELIESESFNISSITKQKCHKIHNSFHHNYTTPRQMDEDGRPSKTLFSLKEKNQKRNVYSWIFPLRHLSNWRLYSIIKLPYFTIYFLLLTYRTTKHHKPYTTTTITINTIRHNNINNFTVKIFIFSAL